MCGQVGIFSAKPMTTPQCAAFGWALYLDKIRGEHSTGVGLYGSDPVTGSIPPQRDWFKGAIKVLGGPENLHKRHGVHFNSALTITVPMSTQLHLLMGHNRAATVGGATLKNAHPFRHGEVIGTHNGTIDNPIRIPTGTLKAVGDTDSEKIIAAIASGISLEEIFKDITGAGAFVWHDEKGLNFYRNDERPLWIAKAKDSGSIFYASEPWMIEASVHRSVGLRNDYEKPEELPVNKHMLYTMKGNSIEQTEVGSPELKKIAPRVVGDGFGTDHDYNQAYNQAYNQQGAYNASRHFHAKPPAWSTQQTGRESSRVTPRARVRGGLEPTGWLKREALTLFEFKSSLPNGCSLCEGKLSFQDHSAGKVHWLTNTIGLCEVCASEFKPSTEKA